MPLRDATSGLGQFLRRVDRRVFSENLRFYESALERELADGWTSLLDVGCGAVSAVDRICATIPVTVGIDAHAPTIARRRKDGPYGRYECVNALDAGERFGPRSFDVVVAMDVVEHFEKDVGYRLLDVLETLARHRVIVFTPNGFLAQGELDGNPFQLHRSGWAAADFETRGYQVTGVNGWRPLRGQLWEPRIRPPAVGHRLSAATQPLVTRRPRLAFQLLAVLNLPDG